MSLPDRAQAHHEPQAALRHPGLVRMGHDAGVAEGRSFERVLARERCAEQQQARLGELALRIEAIGELVRVLTESADEVAVTVFEAGLDITQRPLHLVVVEGQDASHDGRGTRLLQVETFLPGHEEHRDDAGPVGEKALGAALNPACGGRAHREAETESRRVLSCRDQSQGRLGALVEIRPSHREAVVAAAGVRVPHDVTPVVVAEEPGRGGAESIGPARVAVEGSGEGTCISNRGNFYGLLVKCRPAVAGTGTADGRDRQVPVARLVREKPRQEIKALLQEHLTVQRRAGGDHRLGQDGVGVAEPSLRPRPGGIGARWRHGVGGVPEQCLCPAMVGLHGKHLSGTEDRKRHRARVRRAPSGCPLEFCPGRLAHPAVATVGDGATERPDAPAPAVL